MILLLKCNNKYKYTEYKNIICISNRIQLFLLWIYLGINIYLHNKIRRRFDHIITNRFQVWDASVEAKQTTEIEVIEMSCIFIMCRHIWYLLIPKYIYIYEIFINKYSCLEKSETLEKKFQATIFLSDCLISTTYQEQKIIVSSSWCQNIS